MASPHADAPWSLTEHLLTSSTSAYTSATQSSFLAAAAKGRLPKAVLSRWLANDRLYIHSYVRAAGRMLDAVVLPQDAPPPPGSPPPPEAELVDWIAETLVGLRREERLFVDVARRYGLSLELAMQPDPTSPGRREVVAPEAKLPGLVLFEGLFASVAPAPVAPAAAAAAAATMDAYAAPPAEPVLPWLEGAVVLWGTERVYLDAWSWARAQQRGGGERVFEQDVDGGAARREFIPNWTSSEFAAFVDRLGRVLDRAVVAVLAGREEDEVVRVRGEIAARALGKWTELLAAEAAFWPLVEKNEV